MLRKNLSGFFRRVQANKYFRCRWRPHASMYTLSCLTISPFNWKSWLNYIYTFLSLFDSSDIFTCLYAGCVEKYCTFSIFGLPLDVTQDAVGVGPTNSRNKPFFSISFRLAQPVHTSVCWPAAWWRWFTSGRCFDIPRWRSSSWWEWRPCCSWPGCCLGSTTTPTSSASSSASCCRTRCCLLSHSAAACTSAGAKRRSSGSVWPPWRCSSLGFSSSSTSHQSTTVRYASTSIAFPSPRTSAPIKTSTWEWRCKASPSILLPHRCDSELGAR